MLANKLTKEWQILVFILLIGLASRLIPHIPNATSMISLSLFIGYRLARGYAAGVTVLLVLVSNAALNFLYGYPMLGSWLLFMLSGLLAISWCGRRLTPFNWGALGFYVTSGCLCYWLWTNLGVFWLSGYYPHTLSGFITCFYLALPFLGHSLLGNLIWAPMLFGIWQKRAWLNPNVLGEKT